MDRDTLHRLDRGGALAELPDKRQGVRVSLMYQPRLANGSRKERHAELHGCFSRVADQIGVAGARVDLDTLSTSGQTVEAVLPVALYETLVSELAEQSVRVDPIVEHHVELAK